MQCLSVVCVVCCQAEVSVTSWSPVQRSPTDCGASLCVINKPRDWVGSGPLGAAAPKNQPINYLGKLFFFFYLRGRREPAYRTSAFDVVCTLTPVEALHARRRERSLLAKRGIMGEKWPVKFSQTIRLPRNCWVLEHAAKLRLGTDGFTSPCMLRIFSPENPMASAGF
jgi:hypothetical protein